MIAHPITTGSVWMTGVTVRPIITRIFGTTMNANMRVAFMIANARARSTTITGNVHQVTMAHVYANRVIQPTIPTVRSAPTMVCPSGRGSGSVSLCL